MPLNLIILTGRFAINPHDIREGVGHRYVGLYGSLIKALFRLSPESSVFWYSVVDQYLRVITENGCGKRKANMISAVIDAISETFRSRSYLVVIIAYPSVLPRIFRILEYVFCLLILKLFSIERVRIIVDDFDPPVEAIYGFSETKPSTLWVTYAKILEKTTLKFASSIITISQFWKKNLARTYHMDENKLFVVSNGSLVGLIHANLKMPTQPLIVLYAGSARKVKDVDKLVLAIEKLRIQGMDVNLHIAGVKLMDLPSWVQSTHCDWPSFVGNILIQSDVCVIPYPSNKFHFFHSMPAKLFDYMAAGKPVISTNLKEVGDIIRSNNCGLVARDWNEFEVHLERLYKDRELAAKLGNNGRVAVEKYFNYELLAEMFLENLIQQFKIKHKVEPVRIELCVRQA
jgi:glycosyltransferase involved in cell wall biosynthesis